MLIIASFVYRYALKPETRFQKGNLNFERAICGKNQVHLLHLAKAIMGSLSLILNLE